MSRQRQAASTGTGPGAITRDGCSVELYRRSPAAGEAEMIVPWVKTDGLILELGSGTGRVTRRLVEHGFQVTAVDNSAEMLVHIQNAETVHADIEKLDLGRSFDAVVLASSLINNPGRKQRNLLLAACRRHMATDGVAIIERRNPKTFFTWKIGLIAEEEGLRHFIDAVDYEGQLAHLTIRSEADDGSWMQSFTTEVLDDEQFEQALDAADLRLDRWLNDRRTWALAKSRPR